MTEREAIESIKDILEEATAYEYAVCYVTGCNEEPLKMAIEALENQSALLDFLVSLEISNICEDDRMQEWCEEHCKYACPQKECYLKYAEIERGAKNER